MIKNNGTPHLKLDCQVSICTLIPLATAISKTQGRADTSVWWKWPFSIFFIIRDVQRAIINRVCKPELWFLCSAHPIIVHLYEISQKYLKLFLRYRADTNIWAIINKVCKPELWYLCSAHPIIVLYIFSSPEPKAPGELIV